MTEGGGHQRLGQPDTGGHLVASVVTDGQLVQAWTMFWLVQLNDEVFVEASRHAGKVLAGEKGSDAEKVTRAFRQVLVRAPSPEEAALLLKYLESQRRRLESKELSAEALGGNAWALLIRALLNLDEFVTRN